MSYLWPSRAARISAMSSQEGKQTRRLINGSGKKRRKKMNVEEALNQAMNYWMAKEKHKKTMSGKC